MLETRSFKYEKCKTGLYTVIVSSATERGDSHENNNVIGGVHLQYGEKCIYP